jgi:hypothetical protein
MSVPPPANRILTTREIDMRFYSFTNMYLPGIHAGIQTAHAVHAMESQYRHLVEEANEEDPYTDNLLMQYSTYQSWADDHKTIIVKNGGTQSQLLNLYDDLEELGNELCLPTILWREDEDSLNNAITAVGIVVPEDIYTFETPPSMIDWYPINEPLEMKLKKLLDSKRFAS